MWRPRIIPCLTVKDGALVKTTGFKDPRYVGDPLNAVRIFNEKEVDEIVVLDIGTVDRPSFGLVEEIASQCFMPLTYGGGVRTIDDMARLHSCGVEKVSVARAFVTEPELVSAAAERFGSQSVIVCLDIDTIGGDHRLLTDRRQSRFRRRVPGPRVVDAARSAQAAGAGELLLSSVPRDGTMAGYDVELISAVTAAVDVPVVAVGGAGSLADLRSALDAGATAAAAGAMFVFHGRHRAVLISFPDPADLRGIGA